MHQSDDLKGEMHFAGKTRDIESGVTDGLGFGNADVPRGLQADDREFRDVATKFFEPFDGPRRELPGQPADRNTISPFNLGALSQWIKQAERAFEDRANLLCPPSKHKAVASASAA